MLGDLGLSPHSEETGLKQINSHFLNSGLFRVLSTDRPSLLGPFPGVSLAHWEEGTRGRAGMCRQALWPRGPCSQGG